MDSGERPFAYRNLGRTDLQSLGGHKRAGQTFDEAVKVQVKEVSFTMLVKWRPDEWHPYTGRRYHAGIKMHAISSNSSTGTLRLGDFEPTTEKRRFHTPSAPSRPSAVALRAPPAALPRPRPPSAPPATFRAPGHLPRPWQPFHAPRPSKDAPSRGLFRNQASRQAKRLLANWGFVTRIRRLLGHPRIRPLLSDLFARH